MLRELIRVEVEVYIVACDSEYKTTVFQVIAFVKQTLFYTVKVKHPS